jgi:hypothetical protein
MIFLVFSCITRKSIDQIIKHEALLSIRKDPDSGLYRGFEKILSWPYSVTTGGSLL